MLPGLPGLAARSAIDSAWHGLWRGSGGEHRFWLADPPLGDPTNFVVVLPLDALFELRAEAALRFWLALAGRPPGDRRHDLPAQTRERHILILRALDAKLTGASYRVIAEALLGFRGRSKNDWEVSPLKNKVRRLVADGLFYMRGGYRELLHYPVRLPRRRRMARPRLEPTPPGCRIVILLIPASGAGFVPPMIPARCKPPILRHGSP